ncbi:four helix bundle protein [Aliivibrio finisterrensis]|jgi:four helix bundle protein|uniref:Four helix bundle protein n=1 Tax=Aliivibrio finisterrensis TaxID=511998 RepID=A0A4Q5K972_9GAMM|nr:MULTISPECIES: four helix bundle protein [Aliivibrio]MDD9174919.1 four helix bundle protein [Aliivibrio sp. S3TY1]MDD9192134.1 four helix bundle protein [Aliivibrio sp. S2TY2]RYU42426.1 four helix bundle protein [Aliivibrio finisterrensis]RYU67832.1 four helix bundle protein [Aliivibrio finisterrensis]RYU71491.1 four helix bundle protein [Aliivibrio finisterrensis]
MKCESLAVWKRACRLSCSIYELTSDIKDYGFRDQITRSGLSVPSNIAEGEERESGKEKARFLNYSQGSAAELITQIFIGIEIGYIRKEEGLLLIQETREILAIISKLAKLKKQTK